MKPPAPAAVSRPRAPRHGALGDPFPGYRVVFVAVLLCGLSPALAQYSIPWWKIGGGGGTSAGGGFSITGSIGQFDADGPMFSDRYSVSGGFWALPVAVQVAGAPTLHIAKAAPGFAVVWWTPPSTNWVLQESPTLAGTWTNSPSGPTNPVTVPTFPPSKFYRLSSP